MADSDREGQFWNSAAVVQIFTEDGPSSSLMDMLGRLPGTPGQALDIGCGGGRNSVELYRRGWNLFACDAHSAMVEQTAARLGMVPGLQVRQVDMTQLPYADDRFDLVVSSGVFHNAYSRADFDTAVTEAARVLAPGGSMYVNVFVLGGTSLGDQFLTVSDPDECVFLTGDGLRMTLLTEADLLELFVGVGLTVREAAGYAKQEFTGKRDIFQAWLVKS